MPLFTRPSDLSLVFFLLVVGAVLLSVIVGAYFTEDEPAIGSRYARRVAFGLALWLVLSSAPTASGLIQRSPIPWLPLFIATVALAGAAFGLSRVGAAFSHLPLSWLIAFHAFRLPLELILHQWAIEGTIPETMTWSGSNWDVLTGLLAIPAAMFAKHRAIAWGFNVIGGALLVNVMRVAIMSSPLPFSWQVEPQLRLAFYLPYAWIASVCVAGAIAGHVVLTKALVRKDSDFSRE